MKALITPLIETTGGARRLPASLVALVLLSASGRCVADEPVAAVWKERELSFTYVSNVSVYSCNALASRVATILHAVGARDDVKVKASNCDTAPVPAHAPTIDSGSIRTADRSADRMPNRGPGRSQSSMVRAWAMMPTEVTADVAAELERDKSRRELVSHVTGNPLPRFNDPVMFAAQRQAVTLSRKTIGLEPAECELLDQMSSNVFPGLGIDVVSRNLACDPRGAARIPPEIVVEALVVAPADEGGSKLEDNEKGTADPGPPPARNDDTSSQ